MPLVDRLVRRVYDSEIAVDLAAETIAEVFLQRSRFRGKSDPELLAWLNGIADRKLALFYRKSRIEKRALDTLALSAPVLAPDEHREVLRRIDAGPIRELIREELGSLSASHRDALTLRVVNELPYAQVAARLGISEEAARTRVARALKSLRVALAGNAQLEEYA